MTTIQGATPTVLVTSASGKTGLETALQLRARGMKVRAFVRRHDARSRRLQEAGAELFVGNQFSLRDMRKAMAGVQRAYHCAPAAAHGAHFGAVFAVAAREARLEHVVTLGQWLADPSHVSVATRETWLVEQLLHGLPETTLTVNNVGWFADNYFLVLAPAAQLGVLPMPLGPAELAGNAPPSIRDIAAVSVEALVDPARHGGKTYRPTGPELLTNAQIAEKIGAALGRRVRYADIPEWMFLRALRVDRRDEFMMTQLLTYTRDYRDGAFAVHAPNDVVATVTGREPDDFDTIARSYMDRPEAVRSLAHRLEAMWTMAKIMLTRTPDAEAIEQRRDHPLLEHGRRAAELPDWGAAHDPRHGFEADRPAAAPLGSLAAQF